MRHSKMALWVDENVGRLMTVRDMLNFLHDGITSADLETHEVWSLVMGKLLGDELTTLDTTISELKEICNAV